MNFVQRLRKIQRKHKSLLCIGLDTDINKIPEFLFEYGDPVYEFNRRIIDATKDLVCAYKINLAFYESTGEHGWYTVHQTLARIPEEIVTIGDAKRGDIGNSAEMYAKLIVDDYEFAACTVNPYMGEDSVAAVHEESRTREHLFWPSPPIPAQRTSNTSRSTVDRSTSRSLPARRSGTRRRMSGLWSEQRGPKNCSGSENWRQICRSSFPASAPREATSSPRCSMAATNRENLPSSTQAGASSTPPAERNSPRRHARRRWR